MSELIPNEDAPFRREIQLTGGSTFTVSIPKAWADARDIDSGSSVLLHPFRDRLVVTQPDTEAPERVTTLDANAIDTEMIGRQIIAGYAAGADEIVVTSDTGFDSTQRRIVTTAITDLIGYEVVAETEHELVARSLLDRAEISLDSTIDQLGQVSLRMQERAIEAVVSAGNDSDVGVMVEDIVARDDEADRLFALVSRQFYRLLEDVGEISTLQTSRTAAFTQFRIARQLERVADHAELIATLAARQSTPPDRALADQFESVAGDARHVVQTALEGNTRTALRLRDDLIEHLDTLDRELYATQDDDAYLYGRLLESIRRTAEYGGNIAEVITLRNSTETGT